MVQVTICSWTKPGEWINYTDKSEPNPGLRLVDLMYTSNGDGAISLDLDGKCCWRII